MKIAEILKKKRTLSFEVFPPKPEVPMDAVANTLNKLSRFAPDFISCTYGAGGSQRGRNLELCATVKNIGQIFVPHFTCIGSSREDVIKVIGGFMDLGAENLLALRGDYPPGWEGTKGDFSHADELLVFIGKEFPQLSLCAAAYPEKHLTAPSFESDIACLKNKQDCGASFFITQLCHNNAALEQFLEKARKAGVSAPVIAGIMPILSREPVIRMTLSNGCSIPAELAEIMGKYDKDPEGFAKAGMEFTAALIHDFQKLDIAGLHLYTMNKWEALTTILQSAGF
ncbi:MAG: methylenetetrahydrofolate reductase [Treponema sp.]|nr:methylenetetrahydrofolate reductase [Treponema sp.]